MAKWHCKNRIPVTIYYSTFRCLLTLGGFFSRKRGTVWEMDVYTFLFVSLYLSFMSQNKIYWRKYWKKLGFIADIVSEMSIFLWRRQHAKYRELVIFCLLQKYKRKSINFLSNVWRDMLSYSLCYEELRFRSFYSKKCSIILWEPAIIFYQELSVVKILQW